MKAKDLLLVIIQFILLIAFILIPTGQPSGIYTQIAAFIVTFSGIILSLVALLNLGKNLTPLPSPKKSATLVTSGVYKYIRHPIYTGILFTLAGIALYSENIPRFILVAILLLFFSYKSRYEEDLLKNKYSGYESYMKHTGRFLPKVNNNTTN